VWRKRPVTDSRSGEFRRSCRVAGVGDYRCSASHDRAMLLRGTARRAATARRNAPVGEGRKAAAMPPDGRRRHCRPHAGQDAVRRRPGPALHPRAARQAAALSWSGAPTDGAGAPGAPRRAACPPRCARTGGRAPARWGSLSPWSRRAARCAVTALRSPRAASSRGAPGCRPLSPGARFSDFASFAGGTADGGSPGAQGTWFHHRPLGILRFGEQPRDRGPLARAAGGSAGERTVRGRGRAGCARRAASRGRTSRRCRQARR
jgi:hypothetical protein